MDRPPSIVNFERCYLASIVVGVASVLFNPEMLARLEDMFQHTDDAIGGWYMPSVLIISVLVPIALWYFTARRASTVAKWIVVVFFAFNCMGLVTSVAMRTHSGGVAGVLSFIAFLLDAVAVWMLFRPDAKAWFGEPPLEDGRGVSR